MKACDGNRKPQECGIRICNQKYMFMTNGDKDGVKFVVLTRQGGGGATVCKSGKTLCVGVWDKSADQSNGKKQNTGDCQINVQNVAASLS